MARFERDHEARRLGEALAGLRRACGLSQAEAGRRAGMTGQGWGLYEAGKRPGLYRPDVQRRLTAALGASPDALGGPPGEALSEPDGPAPGVRRPAVPWEGPPTPVRRLRLGNDDLAPWAAAGVILEFVPGRWPRPGQGCVVEVADGRLLPRLFERLEDDVLILRGGPAGLASEERLPWGAAADVSAVIVRREPE